MFSGIISHRGEVASIRHEGGGYVLGLKSAMFTESADVPKIGESIAVSGSCLTLSILEGGTAYFDLSSETCRVTTLGALTTGKQVNLEQSLRVGGKLDGHFVTGHVDCTTEVLSRREEGGNTWRFDFLLPKRIVHFIATKGTIALDGISLTVGHVTDNTFCVYIVPHTYANTTLQKLEVGDRVNVEVDLVARYLFRFKDMESR